MPSSWQGCVESLADPYKGRIPLPSVPYYQDQDLAISYKWALILLMDKNLSTTESA